MMVGNLSYAERLGTELRLLRREARMTQLSLSAVSGVGTTTIKDAEKGAQIPKADTLRMLSDGLATYGPGRRDSALAETYYQRLMLAAGYIKDAGSPLPTADRPVDDLTDDEVVEELARRTGNRDVAVSLLAAANNWRQLDPRSQRLVLDVVRHADGDDDDEPPRRPRRG